MKYLNKKHIDFANAILEGKTQHDAYCSAGYNTDKMNKSSIENRAAKLTKDPLIAEYLAERRADMEKVARISRDRTLLEVINFTTECAKSFNETHDPSMANAVFRGLDMRNRMLGYYAPEKVEHSGDVVVKFNIPEPEPITIDYVDYEVTDITE